MCNYLHKDHKPIAETGKGWKLFNPTGADGKTSLVNDTPYVHDKDGFINWEAYLFCSRAGADESLIGFCFFLTKKEAIRAARAWVHPATILPIIYRAGLGQRQEGNFCSGKTFTVALCRSFRLAPLPKTRKTKKENK